MVNVAVINIKSLIKILLILTPMTLKRLPLPNLS